VLAVVILVVIPGENNYNSDNDWCFVQLKITVANSNCRVWYLYGICDYWMRVSRQYQGKWHWRQTQSTNTARPSVSSMKDGTRNSLEGANPVSTAYASTLSRQLEITKNFAPYFSEVQIVNLNVATHNICYMLPIYIQCKLTNSHDLL
jgi:hypothetical protein